MTWGRTTSQPPYRAQYGFSYLGVSCFCNGDQYHFNVNTVITSVFVEHRRFELTKICEECSCMKNENAMYPGESREDTCTLGIRPRQSPNEENEEKCMKSRFPKTRSFSPPSTKKARESFAHRMASQLVVTHHVSCPVMTHCKGPCRW